MHSVCNYPFRYQHAFRRVSRPSRQRNDRRERWAFHALRANGNAAIVRSQKINLAELELVAGSRINRHAMHDGKRSVVMLEQAD